MDVGVCILVILVSSSTLSSSTVVSTTTTPPTTTPPTTTPECQEGEQIGYHTCGFICGLNDQWYPKRIYGGSIPPGEQLQRCRYKGDIYGANCPLVCIDGEFWIAPCYRCCEDYSNNHCHDYISCNSGLYIDDQCDPFTPPTTTTTPLPTTTPPPTPPTTTPECQEGEQIGYHTCSFICGLNDQWYPKGYSGSIPPGERCQTPGNIVEANCPLVCVSGWFLTAPCPRCCEDYSNNHCHDYITCEQGLNIDDNCDPFNPPPARPTSPPLPTTTSPPTPARKCEDGDVVGYHSCSFICGLNDQWYPEYYGGGSIPGAPRCQNKGEFVDLECSKHCANGEYQQTPCRYCCQDYSNNHCYITCNFGLRIHDDCDPFTPPTTTRPPTTISPTLTRGCPEDDVIGSHTCSFICGLNGQWYPETYGGGDIPAGAQRCANRGDIVEAQCPLICVQGQYQSAPCNRCCKDYSNNHCDVTCETGLAIQGDCDPFEGATVEQDPMICHSGNQIGYHSCSFICGLAEQWFPESPNGDPIFGTEECSVNGTLVESQCPKVCLQGRFVPIPCDKCCQDYSSNSCNTTCEEGLLDFGDCNPFNHSASLKLGPMSFLLFRGYFFFILIHLFTWFNSLF